MPPSFILRRCLAGGALLMITLLPGLSEALRRSALYLVILAGLVHTFGLVFRMALEGRPPVTNLYSSAIFIGWGTMILGIIVEYIYRVGIGSIIASLVGFITLLIAHNLALGGDTMEMMRAVGYEFLAGDARRGDHARLRSDFCGRFGRNSLHTVGLLTPLLKQPLSAGGPEAVNAQPASRRD